MSLEIFQDPRIRAIAWRDLVPLSQLEIAKELILSLPFLVASLVLADFGWFGPALAASFFFFLAGLRQVHNAYHYALGIPRAATEGAMFVLSILMLGSMHAVQVNHLQHHKHCMDEDDVEALSARMSSIQALLFGPIFPFLLHLNAWPTV